MMPQSADEPLNDDSGDEAVLGKSNSNEYSNQNGDRQHPLLAARRQASSNRSHRRVMSSMDRAMGKIKDIETATFAMSFRYIEGYLLKEIESKRMLRMTKRHLKYFRIVFSTGKLNIKDDKEQSAMRSLMLKDLLAIKILKLP